MYHGEISTHSIGDGTEGNANRPNTKDLVFFSWSDATGIPAENYIPDPNALNLYIKGELSLFDEVAADDTYFIHWYEEIIEEEFGEEVVHIEALMVATEEQLDEVKRAIGGETLFNLIERMDIGDFEVEVKIELGDADAYILDFVTKEKWLVFIPRIVKFYLERTHEPVQLVTPMADPGKPKDEDTSPQEFGLLRAWCARNGFSQDQINEAIGDVPADRVNGQIAEDLRTWIKEFAVKA